MSLILIIVLLLVLFGTGGGWYAHRTYGPAGGYSVAGLILLVVAALWLFGRL